MKNLGIFRIFMNMLLQIGSSHEYNAIKEIF